MNRRRVIVNADDLGMSRGITDGIIRAHLEGILTSASLMVNQPASEYARAQLRRAPKLDVGIHLNLCEGAPLLAASRVPSLVTREGKFHPREEMIRRLWCWQVSPREIEAEFRAQICWMIERGIPPTHADSHHHVHMYPAAVRPFCKAVNSTGIRCARASHHRHWPRDGGISGAYAGSVLRRWLVMVYRDLLQAVAFRELACPDYCSVPHRRYWGRPDLLSHAWRFAFKNLLPGTYEIGCHPGLSQHGFSENDDIRDQRESELRILMDPQLRSLIEREQIELITYSQFNQEKLDGQHLSKDDNASSRRGSDFVLEGHKS